MINYLKSQRYLMLRSKAFYILPLVCFTLIIFFAITLYIMGKQGSYFPYDNARFYYVNVVGFSGLIIFVGIIITQFFHSKEQQYNDKVSIAYDVPLKVIYFGILMMIFGYFLFICLVSYIIMIVFGMLLFKDGQTYISDFTLSIINMCPLVVGILAVAHALFSMRMNAIGVIIAVLLCLQIGVHRILYGLTLLNDGFKPLFKLTPQYLFDHILELYMTGKVSLGIQYWGVGLCIGIVGLIIGYVKFKKLEY
ncbi:hypothetical protein BU582_05425 [Staphylococcus agnetis]|uniref:hypothetical protein n=1 Tax=Staphylococcus agnetis TaxID=985762 RepID=UPI000D19F068|nr:hypothetical protein [Staphylococcus agnetis]PTH67806.1 hypothetical protein BU582_05425 [Staphylococcus agnetis]